MGAQGRLPRIRGSEISVSEFDNLVDAVEQMRRSLTTIQGRFGYSGAMGSVGRVDPVVHDPGQFQVYLVRLQLDPLFNIPGDLTTQCGFRYFLWPPGITAYGGQTQKRLFTRSIKDYRDKPTRGRYVAAPDYSFGLMWIDDEGLNNVEPVHLIAWKEKPSTVGCT